METIEAVKSDYGIAAFKFRVNNRWIDGSENRSTAEDYYGAHEQLRHALAFELVNDEPPVLLGGDRAPNPVEYLLHALAGCMTTSLIYHSEARGVAIDSVETHFEGDLDLRGFLGLAEVRKGFKEIRVVFDIEGDFDAAVKRELVGLARQYSPVFDMVTNGVPVDCVLADVAQAA